MAEWMFKNNKKLKKAYTLVEILVVIFIFSMIVVMLIGPLIFGYTSGKGDAISKKKINRDLKFVSDTLHLNLQNANTVTVLGAETINAFRYNEYGGGNIKILSMAHNTSNVACVFIGWDATTKAIYELQQGPCISVPTDLTNFKKITSNDVKITEFNFTPLDPLDHGSFTNLKYSITATDNNGQNNTTLQNTYALGYEQWKGMQ